MSSTAIAKKPIRQVDNIRELLVNDQARQQLATVAARHMNPERLMRVTANAIRTTPKLQQCEPLSFLGALMQCAALGLEPNTVLGHAYLVPFDKSVKGPDGRWTKVPEVQLIVGYKGLIDLARRSGHITSISANIHYSDDELWDYEEGTEARLRHRPGPQDGEKMHAYAIAKFTDGGHAYVVLPWAQVMKVRNGSQGWQSAVRLGKTDGSPWKTHEDAMAKKTAIRALAKYLPLSVEFMDAVQVDNDSGSRVDYAAFAMNPSEGPTIEGEFTEPDLEDGTEDAVEVEGPAADARAPDPEPKKAEPKKEPAAEKKAEEKPAPVEKEKTAAPAAAAAKHQKVRENMENDIADGAPPGAIRQYYAEQLDEMAKEAPELHADVEKMLADAEAEG